MSNRDFAIGEQNFKEKPDISQVFIRAIDRNNHVAVHGGYGISEAGIKQILSTLPVASREWVYDQEDRYRKEPLTLIYKKYCGKRLGDPIPLRLDEEVPFSFLEGEIDYSDPNIKEISEEGDIILIDESKPLKRFRGEINLDDPNIISPKIKRVPTLDKQSFNELVMEAAQYAGLTWQSELLLLDGGDTEEEIKRKKTPYRMPDHIREKTQYRITPVEELEE